jgi:hypothetical protein
VAALAATPATHSAALAPCMAEVVGKLVEAVEPVRY